MGHAIALRFARGGHAVTLTDVDRDALDRAERAIRRLAGTQSEQLGGEPPESVMARLRFAEDGFGAAARTDLVIEVISERVDIKRRFYEELAGVVSPSALIASNTSVLDIFEHAPSVLHPQLIMAHYFVPAHIIPLVEIVGHPSNPGQLVPQFAACLSALGMKPVVLKRFARSFIVNRIQRAINQELFQLLDDGVADAAALDDAVSVCLGARLAVMGYLSRLDFTGLDLVLSNYRQVPMGLATDETPPPLLERMVGEGCLGFKSGKGFYGYTRASRPKRCCAIGTRGCWPCSGALKPSTPVFRLPPLNPRTAGHGKTGLPARRVKTHENRTGKPHQRTGCDRTRACVPFAGVRAGAGECDGRHSPDGLSQGAHMAFHSCGMLHRAGAVAPPRTFRCFRRGRRRFPGSSSPTRCCWITWDSA